MNSPFLQPSQELSQVQNSPYGCQIPFMHLGRPELMLNNIKMEKHLPDDIADIILDLEQNDMQEDNTKFNKMIIEDGHSELFTLCKFYFETLFLLMVHE